MASQPYGSSSFARPPGIPAQYQYQYHSPDGHSKWKGPRRVCIFCTMAVVLPSLLISIPLLMRFVIYGSSTYVVHPSDMMMVDQKISTTWCQAENIRLNSTFTAYVTHGEPKVFETPTTLMIDQSMKIPDDQKDYWGMYLLPGSTFRIRICARHKGGTLLIIRGNKHMQYCAYMGEADSAGNSDEVSGSTSVEMNKVNLKKPGSTLGSQESHDDVTILTRLKSYLQSNPNNRGKLQKTLEDWMLLNSSISNISGHENITFLLNNVAAAEGKNVTTAFEEQATSPEPETTTHQPQTSSFSLPNNQSESIERGTIHRKRRDVDIRRDTESGENGAFEDETENEIEDSKNLLPKKTNGSSVQDKPHQTPDSVWKDQHSHHSGVFNITVDSNDGSKSESESSFSSSEEALLKCQGIVASFDIPQEDDCRTDGMFEELSLKKNFSGTSSNVFEFRVKERDYYYFIFGSENEKQTNMIRAKLEVLKMEYQLPEPLENCTGVEECKISFRFASSQKVVIKLPLPSPTANNSVLFVAESECEPRAYLYLIFVILVPLVILLFAFQ